MSAAAPDGEPVPPDGQLPASALGCCRAAAVRYLCACPLLPDALRVLRFQYLHRRGAWAGRVPRLLRGSCHRRGPAGAARARRRGPTGEQRFLRRRHTDGAAARRSGEDPRRRSGRSSASSAAPRSRQRRTRKRWTSDRCPHCVRRGSTGCRSGCRARQRHVLEVLDRVHTPGRPAECVAWARAAGFTGVNLDLIYGTPGETRSRTGPTACRPRSPPGPTISPRTRSSWRKAPGWPRGSPAANYPRPMRTPRRTATSRRTTCLPATG